MIFVFIGVLIGLLLTCLSLIQGIKKKNKVEVIIACVSLVFVFGAIYRIYSKRMTRQFRGERLKEIGITNEDEILKLQEIGIPIEAEIIEIEGTNVYVKRLPVMKITFRFKLDNKENIVIIKSPIAFENLSILQVGTWHLLAVNPKNINESTFASEEMINEFTIKKGAEPIKKYNSDGLLISELIEKDGDKFLVKIEYYNNSNIKKEFHFKNGKFDGPSTSYYENGNIETETYYKKSDREGPSITYYENGNIKTETYYKNDKINGKFKKYDKNGNIEIETYYKNNEREGLSITYYENGNIEIETYYKDDKMNGPSTSYYENGNIEIETYYKNNKIDGKFKRYDKNGKLKWETLYKNGEEVY